MATANARQLDQAYRQRLASTRDLLVAQVKREYAQVTPEDIKTSFAAFADQAVARITAGQATVQTMAAAYVRGFLRAETGGPIELAPLVPEAGVNSAGMALSEAVQPIAFMILGQIGSGATPEEALATGEYLVTRLADNEVTAAADKVIDEQSQAMDVITGWEGIVNPNSCDGCQSNVGVHLLDEEMYRHPGCNCTKVPVHDAVPGQSAVERAAVSQERGAEIEREAATIRAEGVQAEPGITDFLKSIVDGAVSYNDAMSGAPIDGASDLTGLENRIKTLASTAVKITGRVRDEPGLSPNDAAGGIHDLVRYTMRSDTGSYLNRVEQTIRELINRGYTNTKWGATWGFDEPYAGVNSRWLTPGGYEFELQFHSVESFISKELNHAAYDAIKLLDERDPSQALKIKALKDAMKERASSVPRPRSWADLQGLLDRVRAAASALR